jgi:chorismate dehydratase
MTPHQRVRLGAVGYLNARPLVYGLDQSPRFDVRYDVPSECARLLHANGIDVGLIPSIEYLRGGPYSIVPDLAIASRGTVASVALFTTKPMHDVQSVAMDTSSRTSVALVRVLCARLYHITPAIESRGPDLDDMLARCDAALIIGDNALFAEPAKSTVDSRQSTGVYRRELTGRGRQATEVMIEKIDLGEAWDELTGLPFVYAFWAGRADALSKDDVARLQRARDEGIERPEQLAREYLSDSPDRQELGGRYLRHNIKYHLGDEERTGLERFYRYAAEAGVVSDSGELRFFER